MSHRTTLGVRFRDLDPYGHVNHAVYLSYLEVGRTEALSSVGLALRDLADSGFQLVITEMQIRYRGAAVLGNEVTVVSAISKLRRASAQWQQQVLRLDPESGAETALVTAEIMTGVTDNDGKPTRPPPWMFERIGGLVSE